MGGKFIVKDIKNLEGSIVNLGRIRGVSLCCMVGGNFFTVTLASIKQHSGA